MNAEETAYTQGLETQVKVLSDTVRQLEEQLSWFKKQFFGKRSERVVPLTNPQQLFLDGFESIAEPKKERPSRKVSEYTRQEADRSGHDSLIIPADLPVERIVIDLPEDQKICSETGKLLVRIGEEVTRKLAHKPGSFFIKEIVRPKYAYPSREEAGVKIGDLPTSIIPKCRADESLLAAIVTSKFADHLPLYRLSEMYSRDGVQITRQLLSQWIIRLGKELSPIYDVMLEEIKKSRNAFIDESPVRLQVKGKGKLQQGYMWVLVGGEGSDPPHRIYRFFPDRRHENAVLFLQGFEGSLHSDKYGAYERIAKSERILWSPCWAHIRRNFVEAESGDLEFRDHVLMEIQKLFMLEREAWEQDAERRTEIRLQLEEPIIDALIGEISLRMEKGSHLPKSKYSQALHYFYGLIPHLKNYLRNPNARLDNNVAERAIRPLAIGRKNWLFVGSLDGGQSTAVLLSLVQTCRGLEIDPREYLEDIMRRLPDHPANRLHELLPNNWLATRSTPVNVAI